MRNIFFFKFLFEPLVDLVFRLGALDDGQPVPARSLGILRGEDLDPVTVFDHVINGNEFAVGLGSHHFVADRAVHGVSKINGRGAFGQVFHITLGAKAKDFV